MGWGTVSNKCQVGVFQSMSPSTVTKDTASVTITVTMSFETTTYITDSSNSLSWSGAISGTQSPGISYSYDTGSVVMRTETYTVPLQYNTSQSKTVSISLSNVDYAGTTLTASDTITIPARPNPIGVIDVVPTSIGMDQQVQINFSNLTSGYNYDLYTRDPQGNFVEQLLTGMPSTQTSYTWIPNVALYASKIPNATSGTFTVCFNTNTSSGYYGQTTDTVALVVPSNVIPDPGDFTMAEAVTDVNTKVGAYIKSLSKLALNATGGAGVHGSTITKTEFIFGGNTVSGTSWTTDYLSSAGTQTVTKRVTDSRGRTAEKSKTLTVLDYSPPQIASFVVPRADSAGNEIGAGTYGKAKTQASVSSLINSTQKNNLTYTIKSRVRGTTTWTQKVSKTLAAGTIALNTTTAGADLIAGPYATDTAYEFEITVADQFKNATYIYTMSTEIVPLAIGRTGIGVGKTPTRGSVDVSGDIYATGSVIANAFYENNDPIMSKGSNSNGSWVKFSSGLMICWYIATVTDQPIANAYGPVYQSGRTWAFPQAFITAPSVHVGRAQWDTSASWGTFGGPATSTQAQLRIFDFYQRSSGSPFYLDVTAIGYWK